MCSLRSLYTSLNIWHKFQSEFTGHCSQRLGIMYVSCAQPPSLAFGTESQDWRGGKVREDKHFAPSVYRNHNTVMS